ncbi:MAG: ATP-binding protein [Symploca sp. SIO2E6]|nr:ATP-binding protein [Symploca sp. SIO2E6]
MKINKESQPTWQSIQTELSQLIDDKSYQSLQPLLEYIQGLVEDKTDSPEWVGGLVKVAKQIRTKEGARQVALGYNNQPNWMVQGDVMQTGRDFNQYVIQVITQTFKQSDTPLETPENLPHSGAVQFVGREQELEILHQQLQKNERVVVSALTGMGGVGKTELALQYALAQKLNYQGGICWLQVRAGNIGGQIVQFGRSCLQLNPPESWDLPT